MMNRRPVECFFRRRVRIVRATNESLGFVLCTVATVVTVEVWADVSCAFTHFGLRHLVEQRAERGLDVRFRVRAWPLEWVNGRPIDPTALSRQVAALRAGIAPDLFAGFDPAALPATSIPAFGLAAAAYDLDVERGEVVSLALREELFERGRDISDGRVLGEVGAEHAVAPPPADASEAAVRRDWEAGRARCVTGSPHFFTPDGEGFFCPSLEITKGDAGPSVVDRPEVVEAMLSRLGG